MSKQEQKVIVLYTSKRGATRQYARWIAEALDGKAVPLQNCDFHALAQFDAIVYGGWLRGSGIVGLDRLCRRAAHLENRLTVFACGISEYNPQNYQQIYEINFKPEYGLEGVQLYYCPGRYQPERVTGFDRFLMGIARRVLKSGRTGSAEELARTDRLLRDIAEGADHVDPHYAEPVIRAVQQQLGLRSSGGA